MRNKSSQVHTILHRSIVDIMLSVISIIVLLQGCCVPRSVIEKQYRHIESGCADCQKLMLSEIASKDVSKAIHQRIEQLQDFRALRTMEVMVEGRIYPLSEAVLFKKPELFRIETLGAFDQPVVFFVSDGHTCSTYSRTQNAYYRATCSPQNMERLRGLPLTGEDMVLLSTGNPPQLMPIDTEWGFYMPNERLYFLEWRSSQHNLGLRLWVSTPHYLVVYFQQYHVATGDVLLEGAFEDYRTKDTAYPIPRSITLRSPNRSFSAKIWNQYFTVNDSIDDLTIFRQQTAPTDAIVYDLDAELERPIELLAPYQEFQRE